MLHATALLLLSIYLGPGADEVKNGDKPVGVPHKLVLTEELRLGPDSGEDHLTWTGDRVTFLVDSAGNMYVLDQGGNRIIKLNPKGELIKAVGRQGEGPDEFILLSSLSQLHDGKLMVFEQRYGVSVTTVLDQDLNFLDRSQAVLLGGKHFTTIYFGPNRDLVRGYWQIRNGDGTMTIGAGVVGKDFEDIGLTLTNQKVSDFDPTQFSDPNWLAGFLSERLASAHLGQIMVQFDYDGNLYTGTTNKYEITKWSPDRKKLMVITRDAKRRFQTEQEIDALADMIRDEVLSTAHPSMQEAFTPTLIRNAIKKAEFPPNKTPLFGIVPMEGKLMALNDYDAVTGRLTADFFDEKGVYLGSDQLPNINFHYFGSYFGYYANMRFRNGKAYTLEESADGDYFLVRYAYKLVPQTEAAGH